ncbi:MAG TPA: hypothetical protein VH640_15435, partial [Bryobacteraceae bacterium]
APGAILNLSPPTADQTERGLTVELKSAAKQDASLPVKAYLQDRSEPLTLKDALEVTGPLPVIASSKLSLPSGMAIAVRADELPAGVTLNALLDVKNIEPGGVLRLACSDGAGQTASLHIGEQTAHWNLEQISPDQLFLAFDTSGLPAGCQLQAAIDNGRGSSSQPFPLAHILRVPRIDSFTISQDPVQNAPPQNGVRVYQLTGQNLEMIEKLGWDEANPAQVSGLPAPLPGPGLQQSITVDLPDPPTPDVPLYVWLRGDKQGRVASIKWPALPTPPPLPTVVIPTVIPPVIAPETAPETPPPASSPQ